MIAIGLSQAQVFDNFDDGNDDGWTRYDLTEILNDPPPILPIPPVPGEWAEYSFPDDGKGGKAYRVHVLPHPANVTDDLAPRSFPSRPEIYARFRVAADVLDWNTGTDIALGVVGRAANIAFAQTTGYLFNLNPWDQDMDITLVAGEAPVGYIGSAAAPFTPARGPYRFELLGSDDALVGHVYQLGDTRAPVASTAAINQDYASGQAGVLVFDDNGYEDWNGADVTYDNFLAEELPAPVSPQIVLLEPTHLSTARTLPAPVRVSLFRLDYSVNIVQSSITLAIDGVTVPNSALAIADGEIWFNDRLSTLEDGLTVTYTPPAPPAAVGGWHANSITFQDSNDQTVTQEWVYRYAALPVEAALPPGSGMDPGFDVRVVQTLNNQPTENSLWRAEEQLAQPPVMPVDVVASETTSVINYTSKPVPNTEQDGLFEDFATFPGLLAHDDPNFNANDMATEVSFYLELTEGTHQLGVTSDDGFQLVCGSSSTDPSAVLIAEKTEGTFNGFFDMVVPQDGVYPFRMAWFQRGGPAHVELYAQEAGATDPVLINDASSPIKAYRSVNVPSLVLESAALLTETFAEETGATIDEGARRITVEAQGSARFYRLRGSEASTIGTIVVEGATVTLTY